MPVSMCVLMRARYAEQALEAAIAAQGAAQYVIIGAGMDSFAFRRRDLLQRIDVFEIDHPVTQQKKLKRIRRAGLTPPARCRFVAADLSRVAVVDALDGSGFDRAQPTFLSLMGVAYYLTPDDLATLAGSIARNLAPGTRLVIDYLLDKESSNPAHLGIREKTLAFVKARGEPMRSEYSTAAIERVIRRERLPRGGEFRHRRSGAELQANIRPPTVRDSGLVRIRRLRGRAARRRRKPSIVP